MKRALITGIAGQDGSYLAEFLLKKDYRVYGIEHPYIKEKPESYLNNLADVINDIEVFYISIDSYKEIFDLVKKINPDECYHLAAQSFVCDSFNNGFITLNTNIHGTYCVLLSIIESCPHCRIFFASSSEVFGEPETCPQNEKTLFNPLSLYGLTKLAGMNMINSLRTKYNIHASSGILYNHESPRRGINFVTRKITMGAAKIKLGLAGHLELGNLDDQRDWGHAREYVRAMWLMLQKEFSDDYVISSGELHSVKEFLEKTFSYLELDYKNYIIINDRFYRPAKKIPLCGDSTKAKKKLKWNNTVKFDDIIKEMVNYDLKLLGTK